MNKHPTSSDVAAFCHWVFKSPLALSPHPWQAPFHPSRLATLIGGGARKSQRQSPPLCAAQPESPPGERGHGIDEGKGATSIFYLSGEQEKQLVWRSASGMHHTSSRKTMAGVANLARMNVSLSCASPSPTNMLNSCAQESGNSVAREAVAAARARVVLLQPAREVADDVSLLRDSGRRNFLDRHQSARLLICKDVRPRSAVPGGPYKSTPRGGFRPSL